MKPPAIFLLTAKSALFSTILFLFVFSDVFAQATQGTISGRIQDVNGQPIMGISVGLENSSLGNATNEQGLFEIRNVPAGTYTLIATGIGYSASKQNVSVTAGRNTRLELRLDESTQQLNEVVVSGLSDNYKANALSPSLRLVTPILETPQNIQVVTGKLLADQQIFDMLEGVSRNVSGVTKLEHWDNYARLNMRGSRIAPFRNGMNVQSTWGPLAEDMAIVERIEFVKGPAGFMMANGEPSGFYNVVTKKPTGLTRGNAAFTLGSFDTYRATADLDGKLSNDGKVLYRLNLMGQLRGSHRDFEFNNRYIVAPVIKYQINDQTSITAEYTYQHAQMSLIGSAYAFSANGFDRLPWNFTVAEPNLNPTLVNDHSAFLIMEHKLSDKWRVTGQLAYFNYNQVGNSVWADSAHTNGDLFRSLSIWDAADQNRFGQFFVNGEVSTGPVTHRILAGIDLGTKRYIADWGQSFPLAGREPFNIYNPQYGIPANQMPVFDRTRSLRHRAGGNILSQSFSGVYLQDELLFLQDKIRLTLAGRVTSARDSQYGSGTDETVFTPRVGLSGSLDRQTSLYALYDQAFVPQAGLDRNGNAFDPITGNNLEAGLKRDWMNGRWNSTVSVYQITKNNVLTADPENINFSTQLGQTKTQGVEVDLRGELLTGLNLTLNYAYTDARVTKDTNPENVDVAVPGSTRHITNAWLSYRLPGTAVKGLGASLGYQWQLERSSWFIFDGSENSLPDYFRLDGALSWQNDSFRVALNVNNLLNAYLFSGGPYGQYYYWQTEAPRNFRLSLGYSF